jgi:hypothetical protein
LCPLTTGKVLALKATVLVFQVLVLQTLVFLAVSGGVVLAASGAAVFAPQQRKSAAA